jgi:hypothetical protein
MEATFQQILTHLHRGGRFSYWWTSHNKQSLWWPVGDPADVPEGNISVYFGIHPTNKEKLPGERAQNDDIVAINCLYAEFDAKDFGDIDTDGLDVCKKNVLEHIEKLTQPPCVIIDSGGGYHTYWLLKDPFIITDNSTRERARKAQADWVKYVDGDNSAKDLARVLRVPGTRNHKPMYPDAPVVRIVKFERGEV